MVLFWNISTINLANDLIAWPFSKVPIVNGNKMDDIKDILLSVSNNRSYYTI